MACIPKHLIAEFMSRIKSGEITPEKLIDMGTSEARRKYFSSFLGEANAKKINDSFESIVMKDGLKEGALEWAKNIKPGKEKTAVLSRIEQVDKILNPSEERPFFDDLLKHKIGITVTMKEAANIAAFSKDYIEKRAEVEKITSKPGKDQSDADLATRMAYGHAEIAYNDYLNGLKDEAKRTKLKDYIKPQNYIKGISDIGGFAKALKASFDVSVIGRQGFVTAMTHPGVWLKNSARSFGDFYNSMSGKTDALKEVRAEILSRPNALNGLYRKEGLAVGVKEEAFPTSLPEKVPFLGKVFKGSQDSFTAWQFRTRADLFDMLVDTASKTGADITGIGKLINSMTGRGTLGRVEPIAGYLNNTFFSPRYVKSNWDVLTAHITSSDMESFARREAAINLMKVIIGSATILTTAKMLNPDSVENDPRSSDFGKIKIGDTRFNVTGGLSSLITAASRILSSSSKNASTGIVTELNSGKYGAKTGWDVAAAFLEGKLSPMAGLIRDMAKGKDYKGNKVTLAGEAANLLMPLPITNAQELLSDPNSAPMVIAMISDALGIGTNTYGAGHDWSINPTKEMDAFRSKVGDDKFKEANDKFNVMISDRIDELRHNEKFNSLSEDDKLRFLTKERTKIKERVFRQYNFNYRPVKQPELPRI